MRAAEKSERPMVMSATSMMRSAYGITAVITCRGCVVITFSASSSLLARVCPASKSVAHTASGIPMMSAIRLRMMLWRKSAPKICPLLAPRLRKSAITSLLTINQQCCDQTNEEQDEQDNQYGKNASRNTRYIDTIPQQFQR